MIKLERVRTAQAITSALRGKRRINRNVQLLEGFRSGSFDFKSSVWKNAKEQLKAESNNKCAYCEAPTAVVAHGDVEHFRPKSIYWWLAYCYDNYLYSCQICNQSFKSDNFPIAGPQLQPDPPIPTPLPTTLPQTQLEAMAAQLTPDPLKDEAGQPMAQFAAARIAEQAGLLDPYTADPEPFFKWSADDTLEEVALEPRNDDPGTLRIFEATIAFMGLNRPELLKERYTTYNILNTFKSILDTLPLGDPLRAIVENQVDLMMADEAPYAAMVRYFVRVAWALPL